MNTTITATADSSPVLAQPLGGGTWRVCVSNLHYADGTTIGYIDELGGTYEVRALSVPSVSTYVDTFKQAMELFTASPRSA